MTPPRRAALVLCLCLFTSCAAVRSWFRTTPPRPPRPDAGLPQASLDAPVATAPVWLHGPLLRAVHVALADITARTGDPDSSTPFYRCMTAFDAYDVQVIAEDPERWVILVSIHPERCQDAGGLFLDAGAVYEIRRTDYAILSAQFGAG